MNTAPIETPTKPPRWRRVVEYFRRPKIALPLTLTLLLVASPFAYRVYQLTQVPDIGDPFDVEEFSKLHVPDERNAFVEYRKAAKLYVRIKPRNPDGYSESNCSDIIEGGWSVATEDPWRSLVENQLALKVWKKGTEKPDAMRRAPTELLDESNNIVSHVDNIYLTRQALMQAVKLESEGRLDEAWSWLRATYRCSLHGGRNAGVMDFVLAKALHSFATDGILSWSKHPRVTVAHLNAAMAQLREDNQLNALPSTIFKFDYLEEVQLLESEESLGIIIDGLNFSGPQHKLDFQDRVQLYVLGELVNSRRILKLICANGLTQADKPFAEKEYDAGDSITLYAVGSSTHAHRDALSTAAVESAMKRCQLDLIRPAWPQRFDANYTTVLARQAALLMSLAAQRYYRLHDRFPETAAGLLCERLKEIPVDPFSKTGVKMSYRRTADGAVIWSIGADGKDDGGLLEADIENRWSYDDGVEVIAPIARARRPKTAAVLDSEFEN